MTVHPIERTAASSGNRQGSGLTIFDPNVSGREETRGGCAMQRPRVHGKFLYVAGEHFWIRGVTYGTFRPDSTGLQFPPKEVVELDFRAMADAGLNAVRVYTPPPPWLLDVAAAHDLRVMIGLPWEQHITFLDDKMRVRRIMRDMQARVSELAGHPAILCYVVGNEIPPSVVRWYGKARIERFIGKLCVAVKSIDPGVLVTYVNFPTTEYLELPDLDFLAFNVYLESDQSLRSYLARLQNLAGERPLVMAEIGLDSRRNGEAAQAVSLKRQIAATFEAGCIGCFVFAWTDEWFRGGHDIDDWDFGITTRDRKPKAALQAVSNCFKSIPFATATQWPKVSVVVCSYNGARTIGETLAALQHLVYPNYEVIVVDDGSTDQTSAIAYRYNVRLIRTENNGLSAARNQGMNAATGEIVAYIDDDAYPDPHWLSYLVSCFQRTEHAGMGGPNIAPAGDGAIADCIANAPGGPKHVLLSDQVAEHIPGCNMAYRREKLLAIGGFDSRFRVAGDDVDICWRLQERGWTIGFAPTALVWHHCRSSITRYFQQQRAYADAEALLVEKWPEKYNSAGHLVWEGRLYGRGVVKSLFAQSRIYHGVWGSAPFQSLYEPSLGNLSSLTLMPEWYFLLLCLAFLTTLGTSWPPLLAFGPLLGAAASMTLLQAARGGGRAIFHPEPRSKLRRVAMRLLVGWLHVVQPAARLLGRVQHGMGPWAWKGLIGVAPLPTTISVWSMQWRAIESRIEDLQTILKSSGASVIAGGSFASWDLSISGGMFGAARVIAMAEEHGAGRQLCRFRVSPKAPALAIGTMLTLAGGAAGALLQGAPIAGSVLALCAGLLGLLTYVDCATAMAHWGDALDTYLRCTDGTTILGPANSAASDRARATG
jgi:GT2 family glycosyltransferase